MRADGPVVTDCGVELVVEEVHVRGCFARIYDQIKVNTLGI